MPRRRFAILAAAAVSLVCWTSAANAQQTGSRFGASPQTTSQLGSTPSVGGPSVGSGSSPFGSTVPGGTSLGGASAGGGGLTGTGAAGLGATGLSSSVDGFGALGATVGQQAFIGQANPSAGVVGRRVNTATTGLGTSGFGAGGANQFGNRQGGGSGFNNGGSGSAPKLTARPTQRIAFGYDAPTPTVTATTVSTRLTAISTRRPELAGVTVEAQENGRVVLSGTVPSEESRSIAMALTRLEPGVRDVVDEMTVAK